MSSSLWFSASGLLLLSACLNGGKLLDQDSLRESNAAFGNFDGCKSATVEGPNSVSIEFEFPLKAMKVILYRNGVPFYTSSDADTLQVDDQGVSEGLTYTYTCGIETAEGESKLGTKSFRVTTEIVSPPDFNGIQALEYTSAGRARAEWNSGSGIPVSKYQVYVKAKEASGSLFASGNLVATLSASARSHTLTGLGDEIEYESGVRACSTDAICDTNTVSVDLMMPDEGDPKNDGLTTATELPGKLVIQAPWSLSDGAIRQRLLYMSDDNVIFSEIYDTGNATSRINPEESFEVTLSGLNQVTRYFKLKDIDFSGNEVEHPTFTFNIGDQVPPTNFLGILPLDPNTDRPGHGQLRVRWQTPTGNNWADYRGFRIYHVENPLGAYTLEEIGDCPCAGGSGCSDQLTQCVISGLDPYRTHNVHVRAYDSANNESTVPVPSVSYSTIQTLDTIAPFSSSPLTLNISGGAILSWNAATDTQYDSSDIDYEIYRHTGSSFPSFSPGSTRPTSDGSTPLSPIATVTNLLTYTDTAPIEGATSVYTVCAVDQSSNRYCNARTASEFISDITKPTLSVITATPQPGLDGKAYNLSWTMSDNSTLQASLLVRVYRKLADTNSDFPTATGMPLSESAGLTSLAVANNTVPALSEKYANFLIQVFDTAGNYEQRTVSVWIDNKGPTWTTPAFSYAAVSVDGDTSPVLTYSKNASDPSQLLVTPGNATITAGYEIAIGTGSSLTNCGVASGHSSGCNLIDWTNAPNSGSSYEVLGGLFFALGTDYFIHLRVKDPYNNYTTVSGGAFKQPLVFGPLYANFDDLNDYIENDGPTEYTAASQTACTLTDPTPTILKACIHAGLLRRALVQADNCEDIVVTDSLDVFEWSCITISGNNRMLVNTSFKPNKGLADLIDFTTSPSSWRSLSLSVALPGGLTAGTSPSVWWSNTIQDITPSSTVVTELSVAKYVYVIKDSATIRGIHIDTPQAILVLGPGVTLSMTDSDTTSNCRQESGPSVTGSEANSGRCLIFANGNAVGTEGVWIEGSGKDTGPTASKLVCTAGGGSTPSNIKKWGLNLYRAHYAKIRRFGVEDCFSGFHFQVSSFSRYEELRVDYPTAASYFNLGIMYPFTTGDAEGLYVRDISSDNSPSQWTAAVAVYDCGSSSLYPCIVRDLKATRAANDSGIHISGNIDAENIFAYNNLARGVTIQSAYGGVTLSARNIVSHNNANDGLYLNRANVIIDGAYLSRNGNLGFFSESQVTNAHFKNMVSVANAGDGFYIEHAATTKIRTENLVALSNGDVGFDFYFNGSLANQGNLTGLLAANNGGDGILVRGASEAISNVTLRDFISQGNSGIGVHADFYHHATPGTNATFGVRGLNIFNGLIFNNGGYGLWLEGRISNGTYGNLALIGNSNPIGMKISVNSTSYTMNNRFTGQILILDNTAGCTVDGTAGFNAGQDISATANCALVGVPPYGSDAVINSSPSASWSLAGLADSFFGRISDEDSINGSDYLPSPGPGVVDGIFGRTQAQYIGNPTYAGTNYADYGKFENNFRTWLKDSPRNFGTGAYTLAPLFDTSHNRGIFLMAADLTTRAHVFDWRPDPSGVLWEASSDFNGPSPAQQAFVPGTACPVSSLGDENLTLASGGFALRSAVEIANDTIGDDDGLCESNESCIYSPNIGWYQGEGELGTCTWSANGGNVTGVTLYGYPDNSP